MASDSPRRRKAAADRPPAEPPGATPVHAISAGRAALAKRFRARLRVFAARRLADPSESEDVAQDTLRRVLEALREGRVKNPEALPAYVFQTARHVCMERGRSSRRERQALARFGEEPSPARRDPLSELVREERREEVRRALARLEEGDQRLLRLFFYEGADTAEVAERLEITPGAARVRKHRALRRLAEILGEGGT